MSWLTGLTRNWAVLDTAARDPRLRPIARPGPPDQEIVRAAAVIAALPRWQVIAVDPAAQTLDATRATRVWRFVDDIHLRFENEPGGRGTWVTGRSHSRIGRGDLGQNARNLRELSRALGSRPTLGA